MVKEKKRGDWINRARLHYRTKQRATMEKVNTISAEL